MLALVLLVLTRCGGGDPAPAGPTAASGAGAGRTTTAAGTPSEGGGAGGPEVYGERQRVRVDGEVADGLDVPWGITFDRDGAAFVAERSTGKVRYVVPGWDPEYVGTVPGVRAEGEGGLLGLTYVPAGAGVPAAPRARLYAYLSSVEGDNRIVRMDVIGPRSKPRLGEPEVVLGGIPWATNHDGGRTVLGPDGYLWVGTGDAGDGRNAQDRDSLGGKILRIDLDGHPAGGNPFGTPVWSYGHRNVQGLAFDSTGRLWATEFGQNDWDELNLVAKGGNYGWPIAEGDDGPATSDSGERLIRPRMVWTTDEASPSGLAIVDDVAYLAGLRGRRLWQVPLRGDDVGTPRPLFEGTYGRLRTVVVAAPGELWLSTSNRDGRGRPGSHDDRILDLRLRP